MNDYITFGFADELQKISEECDTPGERIRSRGEGRGLAIGGGKGPIVGRNRRDDGDVDGDIDCDTPGSKKNSLGRGRGLSIGRGRGPLRR